MKRPLRSNPTAGPRSGAASTCLLAGFGLVSGVGLFAGAGALAAAIGLAHLGVAAPSQAAPAAGHAPVAAAAPAAEVSAALARALESVSADEMRSDLFFLASDEMRGRDTPSPEQRIAARYIRARLQRLGFQPGGRDGSYLYEYPWAQEGLDGANTYARLTVGGEELPLEWARDYFLARGAMGKRDVAGALAWGGTMEGKELEQLDLTGKFVLLQPLERMPSPRSLQGLQERGAVGVVVLPFGDVARQTEELRASNERYRGTRLTGGRSRDGQGFPIVHLAPAVAERVAKVLPQEPRLGEDLPVQLREVCDYGKRGDAILENVCGFWPGSDPALKNEVILLSAHYDHVGVDRRTGEVFNGADDNGSGTTGLLALAQALKAYGPMRRSVMLIWVSGEEKGLWGSRAWTLDPSLPEGTTPLCNINIDMIGRNAPNGLLITPTGEHPAYSLLTRTAEQHAAEEGFTNLGSADAYWRRSDHMNFADNLKIPVAFLFADVHEDYHKVTDTPDKIDYDKASRVVRLVVRMLEDLQVDKPQF